MIETDTVFTMCLPCSARLVFLGGCSVAWACWVWLCVGHCRGIDFDVRSFQSCDVFIVLCACFRVQGGRRFALLMLLRLCALIDMLDRCWFSWLASQRQGPVINSKWRYSAE